MVSKDKLIVIGGMLRRRRKALDMTLREVSERVGVSENYISEIEKGTKGKVPSDCILRDIAEVYQFSEQELFKAFGKLPISLVEELAEKDVLLNTLYRIKKNKNLSDEDRDNLYNKINQLYEKHLKGDE
jgi:transcriptional regulator with XRE-family HTH domain